MVSDSTDTDRVVLTDGGIDEDTVESLTEALTTVQERVATISEEFGELEEEFGDVTEATEELEG